MPAMAAAGPPAAGATRARAAHVRHATAPPPPADPVDGPRPGRWPVGARAPGWPTRWTGPVIAVTGATVLQRRRGAGSSRPPPASEQGEPVGLLGRHRRLPVHRPDASSRSAPTPTASRGPRRIPGGPSYYAWYEMYPDNIVVLPTRLLPGRPGRRPVRRRVTESGSSYHPLDRPMPAVDVLDGPVGPSRAPRPSRPSGSPRRRPRARQKCKAVTSPTSDRWPSAGRPSTGSPSTAAGSPTTRS